MRSVDARTPSGEKYSEENLAETLGISDDLFKRIIPFSKVSHMTNGLLNFDEAMTIFISSKYRIYLFQYVEGAELKDLARHFEAGLFRTNEQLKKYEQKRKQTEDAKRKK